MGKKKPINLSKNPNPKNPPNTGKPLNPFLERKIRVQLFPQKGSPEPGKKPLKTPPKKIPTLPKAPKFLGTRTKEASLFALQKRVSPQNISPRGDPPLTKKKLTPLGREESFSYPPLHRVPKKYYLCGEHM